MRTTLRLILTFVATAVVLAACGTQPPVGTSYELTVTVAGSGTGTVTSDPGDIDTGASVFDDAFAADTEVTLTAVAAAGSSFAGWTGACTGATSPCVVTMDAAKSVTATFTLDITAEPEDLTVNVVAGGSSSGSVTSSPAGIDVDDVDGSATASFDVGATVTLTATATAGGFAGWTGGDCDGLFSTTCVVTMGVGEAAVTANFNDVTTLALIVAAEDSEEFLAPSLDDPTRWGTGFSRASSSDLEFVFDDEHAQQVVGLRFNGVNVPAGARVLTAVMNFVATANPSTGTSGDVTVTIAGEAALAPSSFVTDPGVVGDPDNVSFDITTRTTTTATADWAITGAWAAEETYTSANAATVLQEIVDLDGWTSGGDVVFVITGDGTDTDFRRAYAIEGDAAKAATLLVEYIELPLP